MKIAFACDHAGFSLKEAVLKFLQEAGHQIIDEGTFSEKSVDYPDFSAAAAQRVSKNEADYAVVICGSGIGVSITANKVKNVRCALCMTPEMARLSRQHNDANALAMGARLITKNQAIEILKTFLTTEFEGGRHLKRVEKIHKVTNC